MPSDTMPPEKLTEDLLARLLFASNPREYLDQGVTVDRTLAEYLHELLRERGVKRAAVIRASGIHPTVVYDIFTGKSRPGRDHAIMLAFGLGCSLRARHSACFAWRGFRSCGPRCAATPS